MSDELEPLLNALLGAAPHLPPERVLNMFKAGCAHYAELARPHMATKESRINLAYTFMKEVDAVVDRLTPEEKNMIQCRKGCAHCCKMRVAVTLPEAELLLEVAEEEGIVLDKEYLQMQATLAGDMYRLAPELNRCVFLGEDDTCKVYEYRPIVCRKYLVATDPDLCNTMKHPLKQVASLFLSKAEMIDGGIFMADKPNNFSMPQALLKAMETK